MCYKSHLLKQWNCFQIISSERSEIWYDESEIVNHRCFFWPYLTILQAEISSPLPLSLWLWSSIHATRVISTISLSMKTLPSLSFYLSSLPESPCISSTFKSCGNDILYSFHPIISHQTLMLVAMWRLIEPLASCFFDLFCSCSLPSFHLPAYVSKTIPQLHTEAQSTVIRPNRSLLLLPHIPQITLPSHHPEPCLPICPYLHVLTFCL